MYTLVFEPRLSADFVGEVRDRRPAVPYSAPAEPADVPAALTDVEGPVAFVLAGSKWRAEYLEGLSAGDWVVTKTTGYDHYPLSAFEERGVTFSNLPGVTTEAIADHAFALLLSASRRLRTYHDQQHHRVWERRRDGMTDFVDDVCCVVGIGLSGEAVARRATAFGMTVRGVKRDPTGYAGVADEVYPSESLLEALDGARVVVLCVPLTEETRGLVGARELSACADDAVVVNVCRGPVLQTDALVAALDAGDLHAAGIDVVDERPPPQDWPLWDRDDVVVTPHVAGTSDKSDRRYADAFLEEFDRIEGGADPRHRLV